MKLFLLALTCCLTCALALSIPLLDQVGFGNDAVADRCLIEVAPGETRWIKEDEKWELRRVSISNSAVSRLVKLDELGAKVN